MVGSSTTHPHRTEIEMTTRNPHPPIIIPPRRHPRRALAAVAAVGATLALAACGGGDGDSTASDSTGATADVEALSMPASDFSVLLEDEKVPVLKQAMAATPACDGSEYSYDYLLMVSTDAAMDKKGLTLGDIVEDNCT
jgi:hypothetical protein